MAAKMGAARREAFFRALAETGNQTLAAERAKVSREWVRLCCARDADFRARVDAVTAQAAARLRGAQGVGPARGWGTLDGEELVVRGGNGRRVQIARARLRQWTPRVEARFLAVLAATCNVTAACAAVGLSKETAYQHARRWDHFADRWRVAIEEGYVRIEMALIERATRSLSPDGAQADDPDDETRRWMCDDALFQQMYLHRYRVKGVGKPVGRQRKWRPDAADEALRVLERNIEKVERRRRDGMEPDAATRAKDRREWTRRGAI